MVQILDLLILLGVVWLFLFCLIFMFLLGYHCFLKKCLNLLYFLILFEHWFLLGFAFLSSLFHFPVYHWSLFLLIAQLFYLDNFNFLEWFFVVQLVFRLLLLYRIWVPPRRLLFNLLLFCPVERLLSQFMLIFFLHTLIQIQINI